MGFVRAAGFAQKQPQCVLVGTCSWLIRQKTFLSRILTNQNLQSSNEHCLTWCGWPRRCILCSHFQYFLNKFGIFSCCWDWQLEWNRVENFFEKVNFNGGHVLKRSTPGLKCKSRFVLFRKKKSGRDGTHADIKLVARNINFKKPKNLLENSFGSLFFNFGWDM